MIGSAQETALTGSHMDMGAMAGLTDTRFGINFIQANLAHMRDTKKKPFGIADKSLGNVAKCIRDHPRESKGELELKTGDIVLVVDGSNCEWSFVNHNGKYGFVAKCFLKETNEKPVFSLPPVQVSPNSRRATYDPKINSRTTSPSPGSVRNMLQTKVSSSGQSRPPVPPRKSSTELSNN